jgi:hypothetical protein
MVGYWLHCYVTQNLAGTAFTSYKPTQCLNLSGSITI